MGKRRKSAKSAEKGRNNRGEKMSDKKKLAGVASAALMKMKGFKRIGGYAYMKKIELPPERKLMVRIIVYLVLGAILMGVVPIISPAEGANTVTYEELAEHWAPVWYQDTYISDYRADYITNFDFDGNWSGTDNWENLPNFPLNAYIYYWVVETDTHWFIGYADFHPRDWKEVDAHENDMEGCLLVIKRDGSPYGSFFGMITVAHVDFYSYKESDIEFYDNSHPLIYVEAKGHGVYGKKSDTYQGRGSIVWIIDFPDFDGVVYYPIGTAEEPSDGNDRNVGYALKSIDELWSRRGDYDETFASFGTFKGDNYGQNKANAPWGWDDWNDVPGRGEIFTNPVKLVDYHLNLFGDDQFCKDEMSVMGVPPVRAVVGDRHITAGFSKEGKLVTFFYPTVGAYDSVPYYTTMNPNEYLYGAPEHLGGFLGIVDMNTIPSEVYWLLSPSKITHRDDMPAFMFDYSLYNLKVNYTVFAPKGMDSVVYIVNISNEADESINTGVAYHAFFDPAKLNQYPHVLDVLGGWNVTGYPRVKYDDGKLIWLKESTPASYIGFSSDLSQVMYVDAKRADARNPLSNIPPTLPINKGVFRHSYTIPEVPADGKVFEENTDPCAMNGILIWEIDIPAHSSKTFKIVITAADSENSVKWKNDALINHDINDLINAYGISYWQNEFLVKLRANDNYKKLSNEEKRLMEWWVMTMALNADQDTGAIIASPNLIPKYFGSWPRDGVYQSLAWIALGYDDIAKDYFDYLFELTDYKNEHRWYQCYDSNEGEYVGFPVYLATTSDVPEFGVYNGRVLEEDQMSMVLLGIWYYNKTFGQLPVPKEKVQELTDYIDSSIIEIENEITKERDKYKIIYVNIPDPLNPLQTIYLSKQFHIIEKEGLVRPSSDAYEFPGDILGKIVDDLSIFFDLESADAAKGGLIPSRQSHYVNFAAASALMAAYDITGDNDYRDTSLDLRDRSKEVFWNEDEKSFWVAWSIFSHKPYNRSVDVSTTIAWPIQAYELSPAPDQKLKDHYQYVKNKNRNPENPENGLFVAGLLGTQIYENIVGVDPERRYLDDIITILNKDVRIKSDYIPEKVKVDFSDKYLGSEPLGWSHATAIMVLLTKAGYEPPYRDWDKSGKPIALFSYDPSEPFTGQQITFDASTSEDPDGFIQSYAWDFGEGSTGSGETVTHMYNNGGTYHVTLTVTDNEGNTDSKTKEIEVNVIGLVASFTYTPLAPLIGQPVKFDASSSEPSAEISSYDWNFGDNSTASGKIVNHTYSSVGTYTVMLTVTNDTEKTDSLSKEITVLEMPDTTLPTVSITSPQNDAVITGDFVEVLGTASDNEALSTIEIKINAGEWFSANIENPGSSYTLWNVTAVLNQYRNTIYAKATDTSGNTNTTHIYLTRVLDDEEPPFISITFPKNKERFPCRHLTVHGEVSDEHLDKVQVKVGGGAWWDAEVTGNTWSAWIELTDYYNTIYAKATDKAGNSNQTYVIAYYDPDMADITVSKNPDHNPDYTNLQDAINHANPGETIYAYEATYSRPGFSINTNNITLIAASPNTVIDGSGSYRATVYVKSNNVTINGFTIRNADVGISIDQNTHGNQIANNRFMYQDCGLELEEGSHDNKVERNTINSNENGIYLDESNNNTITGNTISTNYADGHGIYLIWDSNWNNIRNNQVSSNRIGIYLDDADNNDVSGNTLNNNYCSIELVDSFENIIGPDNNIAGGHTGIGLCGGGHNQIIGNTVNVPNYEGIELDYQSTYNELKYNAIKNSRTGIYIESNSDNTDIIENSLESNDYGMIVETKNSNIIGNHVKSTVKTGIGVYNIGSTIKENTIEGTSQYYGLYVSGSPNLVYHNNLINNHIQAKSGGGASWDNGSMEGGNYWSDHTCTGNPSNGSQPYTLIGGIDNYPFQDRDGWFKEWRPYIPSSDEVSIEIKNRKAIVDLTLTDDFYRVKEWGAVRREKNILYVDSEIEHKKASAGFNTTLSHTYDLGELEGDNYTFLFKSHNTSIKPKEFRFGPVVNIENVETHPLEVIQDSQELTLVKIRYDDPFGYEKGVNLSVEIKIDNITRGITNFTLYPDTDKTVYFIWIANLSIDPHELAITVNGSNINVSQIQTIYVNQKPDIVVNRIEVQNADITSGELVKINATLQNVGETNTSYFITTMVVYQDQGAHYITNLSSGESKNVTFEWTALYGNHNFTIQADSLPEPYGSIPETNESNNQISISLNILKGDSAPIILAWNEDYFYHGINPIWGYTSTVFEYRVKYMDYDNDPPASEHPSLWLDINGDGDYNDVIGGFAEGNFTMNEVNVSDTIYSDGKLYSYSTSLPCGANHTYKFSAIDGTGMNATGNVDVNKGPFVEHVSSMLDLMITEKWVNWPECHQPETNCTICYNLTNTGNGNAPAGHNTTLYVDGEEVAHDYISEDLAHNASHIGCFEDYNWTYTPPEDNITVCADNNETVDESNETNNCLTNIWKCGDVNKDGRVTMSDVRKVYNRYLDPSYSLCNEWAGDVNCDGRITMSDVRKVYNRYLDPSYDLNCCCEQVIE